MTTAPLNPPGLYVLLDGHECQVIRRGGWKLLTRDPSSVQDGFRPIGHDRFIRPLGPQDRLSVVRLSYTGTYDGVPIDAEPNARGRVMMSTSDPRAHSLGFASLDRGTWELVVSQDDPRLQIFPRQESIAAPWLDEDSLAD